MTTGGLFPLVGTTSTRGKATRARRTVALAAFRSSSDVHLVDLDWTDQIKGRRIERFSEALDAPVDRLVRDVDFHLELANTRVEPEERVDREQPLSERDL